MPAVPEGAKVPKDHKPPADEVPPPDRVRKVEWEDHKYDIDPRRLEDIAFMELLADMDTKPYYIGKVVAFMLGESQWAAFKTNHADDDGLLPADRVAGFFGAINEQLDLGN